jgi:hypothetical protein
MRLLLHCDSTAGCPAEPTSCDAAGVAPSAAQPGVSCTGTASLCLKPSPSCSAKAAATTEPTPCRCHLKQCCGQCARCELLLSLPAALHHHVESSPAILHLSSQAVRCRCLWGSALMLHCADQPCPLAASPPLQAYPSSSNMQYGQGCASYRGDASADTPRDSCDMERKVRGGMSRSLSHHRLHSTHASVSSLQSHSHSYAPSGMLSCRASSDLFG